MNGLTAPFVGLSVAIPLLAAIVSAATGQVDRARKITIAALTASLLLSVVVLWEVMRQGGALLLDGQVFGMAPNWFAVDNLSAVLMVLFPALALVSVIAAPRRDADRQFLTTTLIVVSATLATYGTQNLLIFFAGWTGSLLPFLARREQGRWFAVSRYTMLASSAALGVAVAAAGISSLRAGLSEPFSMAALSHSAGSVGILTALTVAALLRTGVVPGHRGIAAALGGSGMLLSTLLINGHQGLYLLARIVMPLFRTGVHEVLPWLSVLALLSCLYMAVMGLAEKKPEGLLATVFVSQACALFAGLATRTPEGVTGALFQWIVLAVCSTVLMVVYRCLQARTDGNIAADRFNGFAGAAPAFAAMFAVSALALAGLPGTLGFSGEDLLMHGVLAAHGWFGAILPIAIALNAFHVYRLFARLFMGEQRISSLSLRDALPRERSVLFAVLGLLIWLGLAPGHAVQLRDPAARMILGIADSAKSHLP